ncbi:MAG: NAD(P)-dependent oxidoreductase [Chloroflexi bacterium]|nr:NAD(P)-dependent oxidoreductase [Chloroflexota bacterium]
MILVTGGTGMAGSFVVRELQRRGCRVRVLARHESAEIGRALGVEIVPGDLADAESLRRAVAGTSGIIHVARADGRPEIDIAAMETLLDAWESGPFVFISSVDVYGYATDRPITENTPLHPYSAYGAGKVRCEAMLQAAAIKGRYHFSILRPPHIWGPHPRCRERLISARIKQGQPVILPGATAEEWSQFGDAWVDTRELAWAAAECLDRPLGGAANIINDHFGWHELYTALIHLAGSSSPIVHRDLAAISDDELPNKLFYAQSWRYSNERIEQQLGFQAMHQWQTTLAEIVALDP